MSSWSTSKPTIQLLILITCTLKKLFTKEIGWADFHTAKATPFTPMELSITENMIMDKLKMIMLFWSSPTEPFIRARSTTRKYKAEANLSTNESISMKEIGKTTDLMAKVTSIFLMMAVSTSECSETGSNIATMRLLQSKKRRKNLLKWCRSTEEATMFIVGNSRTDSCTVMGNWQTNKKLQPMKESSLTVKNKDMGH